MYENHRKAIDVSSFSSPGSISAGRVTELSEPRVLHIRRRDFYIPYLVE